MSESRLTTRAKHVARLLRGGAGLGVAGVLLAATMTMLAGVMPASAEDCVKHDIDLGEGVSIKGGCSPLRIAYLTAGSNNLYVQAGIKGAQEAAAAAGATLDVFDPDWSPTRQFNQAQNVIASGKYDAMLVEMNDGLQACDILTKQAPSKGMLVAVANQPLCGRSTNEGDGTWAPGTLNYVGGQTYGHFYNWVETVAKENPGPQTVVALSGPELNGNTINFNKALKEVQAKYPDFKVIAVVPTNYSIVEGNSKGLPLFQGNPDATILISAYSDISRGAVQALRQLGALKKMKIYDWGGSDWAFQAVKQDVISNTAMLQPYTEMHKGVESIVAAWKGEKVERYTALQNILVNKSNVENYKPQY